MIEWLKANAIWIKNLSVAIFSGLGAIIAILTYKNAKATILRPVVIKKQADLITEILEYLSEHENNIDVGLDYIGVASSNALLALRDYGFVFKDHKEKLDKLTIEIDGWIPCGASKTLWDIKIIGMFNEKEENEKDKNDSFNLGKEKFERAKKGIIEIDKIYFTKKYSEFYKKLSGYANSPFLPKNINEILNKIINDVHDNLVATLKQVLEKFMKEFCDKYFNKNEILDISPSGVYNEFNHKRIHHKLDFEQLKNEVRVYLKIDEKW